jgi:hypothetical protein
VITTPDLIHTLAGDLAPVRRLRPPLVRAGLWLALALGLLLLLALGQGVRPDLAVRLGDRDYVGCVGGALLTGIAAAIGAFMLSLPDRSRWWGLLPLPAVGLWFANIGYECLTNWVVLDPSGMTWGETARCFATLVLAGLPLSLVMYLMLRYSAAFRPTGVALTGSLAIAGLTAAALSLFHVLDASLLVIMWNIGTAVVFVGAGSLLARRQSLRADASASI